MEEVVEAHDQQFEIDEDREDGKITISGHNNKVLITCHYVNCILLTGHNNIV